MRSMFKNITSDLGGKIAFAIIIIFIMIACLASVISGDPSIIPEGALPYQAPGHTIGQTGQVMRFGTDQIGRDVWAGLIHGFRWALLVGFLATFISACIGVFFGVLAGYFGDTDFKVNRWSLLLAILLLSVVSFYLWYINWSIELKFVVFIGSFSLVIFLLPRLNFGNSNSQNKVSLPLDFIILRIIEIWRSIPGLFILLAILVAVAHPSLWTVIIVIGILGWTRIARLVRAEFLSIRDMNYIKSAKSVGFSQIRIILKHALPNAIAPLFVLCAFSISSVIILEATLSFLGIGASVDTVTWGSLMSAARQNYRAWWLVLFPGLCIFLLVLSLNIIGDRLSREV